MHYQHSAINPVCSRKLLLFRSNLRYTHSPLWDSNIVHICFRRQPSAHWYLVLQPGIGNSRHDATLPVWAPYGTSSEVGVLPPHHFPPHMAVASGRRFGWRFHLPTVLLDRVQSTNGLQHKRATACGLFNKVSDALTTTSRPPTSHTNADTHMNCRHTKAVLTTRGLTESYLCFFGGSLFVHISICDCRGCHCRSGFQRDSKYMHA